MLDISKNNSLILVLAKSSYNLLPVEPHCFLLEPDEGGSIFNGYLAEEPGFLERRGDPWPLNKDDQVIRKDCEQDLAKGFSNNDCINGDNCIDRRVPKIDGMYSSLCARSRAASVLAEITEHRLLSSATRKSIYLTYSIEPKIRSGAQNAPTNNDQVKEINIAVCLVSFLLEAQTMPCSFP